VVSKRDFKSALVLGCISTSHLRFIVHCNRILLLLMEKDVGRIVVSCHLKSSGHEI